MSTFVFPAIATAPADASTGAGLVQAAIITAISVIVVAALGAIGAMLSQRLVDSAARRRWRLETDYQDRTRDHETRRRLYADFLASTRSTGRVSLKLALDRRAQAAGREPDGDRLIDQHGLEGHSPQETVRLHGEVLLLARSPSVRHAATDLMDNLWLPVTVPWDAADFDVQLQVAISSVEAKRQRFIEAARHELLGRIGTSPSDATP